jgi:hypothetical protein
MRGLLSSTASAEPLLYRSLGGQVWMQMITEAVELDTYQGALKNAKVLNCV